ncbi:MAG: hypothetical protein IPJ40_05010 [Saprospirales bacterium]|nr:hypothetical protein [Saprospirales bacterium]
MKTLLPVLLLLSFHTALSAQIGFSGSYTRFVANEWETFLDEQIGDYQDAYFFRHGFQVGADYWLRLKNVRIEFLPEVRYAQQKASRNRIMMPARSNGKAFLFTGTPTSIP